MSQCHRKWKHRLFVNSVHKVFVFISSCRASFLKELKELAMKRRQILSSKSLSEDEKNTRLQDLMLRNPLGSGPPLSIEDLG